MGTHSPNSAVVKHCKATQPFGKYTVESPDGPNELIEFFNVFGVQVDMDGNVLGFAVLRFKSTKIKVYKQFNTRMQTCQIPRSDGKGKFRAGHQRARDQGGHRQGEEPARRSSST